MLHLNQTINCGQEHMSDDAESKIFLNLLAKKKKAEKKQLEMELLRDISELHGKKIAYLLCMMQYLNPALILGTLLATGALLFHSAAHTSLTGKLDEAIKVFFLGVEFVAFFGISKCLKI